MIRIQEITKSLETWAPRGSQQSYDNVGLHVGNPDATINKCLIALDLTPAVINEAVQHKAQLIITHHPLIFRPLKRVVQHEWHGSLIHSLIANDIGLYCIHTNLDTAYQGVSFALAKQLSLEKVSFLRPTEGAILKLVTFVPLNHLDLVRKALAHAGAGHIGHYEGCAFTAEGTGFFTPSSSANPTIGEAGGKEESVKEARIEVEVQRWSLQQVIKALQQSHPYEEVAYDVYSVNNKDTRTGMGAIGELSTTETLSQFLTRVSGTLSTPALRFTGNLDSKIKKVAVCGGAGSDLIDDALQAGADAYVTSDITYHRYFEVLDNAGNPKMALINAGHYETEACAESMLQSWLQDRFSSVVFLKTTLKTSPVKTYTVS